MDTPTLLTGHLLIAMPAMMDPNFHRTVTYICEHSDQGALGLIINRPLDMDLGQMFEQLSMSDTNSKLSRQPVLRGGPVQLERGFVLHESKTDWDATVSVADSIHVTTSRDILTAMAEGKGPERALVALGYAGWGAGQLEEEITANAWLSVPAVPHVIFDTPYEKRWEESARLLGIDPALLSAEAGHA